MLNTIVLLGTLTGILLAIGFFIAGPFGALFALILSVVINFAAYWYSDRIVLRMYKAKPTNGNTSLDSMIDYLAKEAKLPRPKAYTMPTQIPNAFATGRDPKHAAIAVTEGLLELEEDEIKGVIAHEIAHIKNRDVLVSTLAATIAGAISYVAHIGYWSMFMGDSRQGGGNLFALVLMVVFAPIAALLIRLAITRSREYGADRTGVLLTKNPPGLISALRKISRVSEYKPIKGSSATSHMWIVNPFTRDRFTSLFSTHPPIESRIQHLEEMMG
jgi:heat shock protein HtpX